MIYRPTPSLRSLNQRTATHMLIFPSGSAGRATRTTQFGMHQVLPEVAGQVPNRLLTGRPISPSTLALLM